MRMGNYAHSGQAKRRPWRPMWDRVPREHKLIVGETSLRCGVTPAGTVFSGVRMARYAHIVWNSPPIGKQVKIPVLRHGRFITP